MTIVPAKVFRARDDFDQACVKLAAIESDRRVLAARLTVAQADNSPDLEDLKAKDSASLTEWYALYTARKDAAKVLVEALEIDPKALGEALR